MKIKGTVLGLLLVLAASQVIGCEQEESQPHACTLRGCGPQIAYKAALPGSSDEIRQYTVQACVNEQCRTILFADFSKEQESGGWGVLQNPDPQSSSAEGVDRLEASVSHNGETYELVVHWWAWNGTPADKEQFRLTLVNAAGETLLNEDRPLAYIQSEPNGPDCGVCFNASLEEATTPEKKR